MSALRQDVKGALRGLWKSPGFAVAALMTLSLGIGATSAIFAVVKAVLLTPLPYDSPEQRVMVWSRWVSFEKTWVSSQEVFDFTADAAEPTALWRPLRVGPSNLNRTNHQFYAAALLAPGQTPETATAELGAITERLTDQGAYDRQMQFTAFAVGLDREIRGELRPAMWLLMGGVGFLLLIACVNVANLLLVRGDARVREMAVRMALGASPKRLVRQLFTESVVLAIVGAVVAVGLASAALRVLTSVDPTSLPPLAPVRLDPTVLGFTLLLAVVTTLLFGLAPASRTLHVDLVESLTEGGQNATVGHRRQRLRGTLVAVEVALAVVLVIGAGLMIRTLAALGDIDLGFNPDRVLTMRVTIAGTRYATHESVVNFFDELQERVAALSGVEAAGVVRALPLATAIGDYGIDIDGFEESPGREAKGHVQVVSHGAFAAMGTRLVRGRWFNESDTMVSVPVAVVNETMARTYWTDPSSVVGGRIRLGSAIARPWATVRTGACRSRIYGVLAYFVSQRTQEIGVRLAIGAERSQVLGMVLRQGLSLAAVGIVVGLMAAFALTRLMRSLLYLVRPNDPMTFVAVAAALLLVALLASFLPALRATRVSPAITLRSQ